MILDQQMRDAAAVDRTKRTLALAIAGDQAERRRLEATNARIAKSARSLHSKPSAGARRYLFRDVPHGSLPSLLAAAALLALQRLVLPVLHWLDDGRAFGTLRPRDHGAEGP